jgi:hypothetical protein
MAEKVLIFLSAAFILLAVWGGEPLSSVVDPFLQSLNRISAPAPDQEGASAIQAPYPPPMYNRRLFLPVINKN